MSTVPVIEPLEPAKWPKVVGIISIVWASLGLICGGCGVGMMFAAPSLMAMAGDKAPKMPPEMMNSTLQLVTGVVQLAWTPLLLIAGIVTLRRKPAGRPLHLVWAVGTIILSVAGIFAGYIHNLDVLAWVSKNPNDPAAKMVSPGSLWGGLAFGVLLGFAWPLFCLAWFGPSSRAAALDGGHADLPAA